MTVFAAASRAVQGTLVSALRKGVERGALRVTFASGDSFEFGDGKRERVSIRFEDPGAELALALDPALQLGKLFVDGRLHLEEGNVYDFITLFKRSARRAATAPALAMHGLRSAAALGRAQISRSASAQNVAYHYDLDERFYSLFLDEDLQYSCAYFEHEGQSLEGAQLAKKRHLAAKLLVEPGQRVLDIGSGFGGMALYLSEVAQARITGITLSRSQLAVSMRRAQERGLSERAQFLLKDYRDVSARFDRIISVGMFEHVGLRAYDAFFRKCAQLLEPRGVMMLHAIGRTKPRPSPSPFIDRYVFPGSYIPALSEVLPAVERAGFLTTDIEILPLHYAQTLRAWRQRFDARRAEVVALYDERLARLWELYLASSEAGFRMDRLFVFQLQLTRHQKVVPTRRDYVAQREAALRAIERETAAYHAHAS